MSLLTRYLPFAASTTPLHAATYLLGISLFSISFLVFLNSSVSFVITDLIGQKDGVGDVVGTLGFADEIVALIACPIWGLISTGWAIFFAVGATAAATMVTAILPSLTDESDTHAAAALSRRGGPKPNASRTSRESVALSLSSELTITPERYTRTARQASALAGYVGVFTGCGALLALSLFLPLPARFGEMDGVSTADAVTYAFYVVSAVSLLVAGFVFVGLKGLKGEDGKGWAVLFGSHHGERAGSDSEDGSEDSALQRPILPYRHLLKEAVKLGFSDSNIALGYLGGFVARASTVAISLFIPLFVNTYFISNGFCQGSPTTRPPNSRRSAAPPTYSPPSSPASPSSSVSSAPRSSATSPAAPAAPTSPPEIKDVDGRGGGPLVFLLVALMGISQIGAIVCSLGSLGRGDDDGETDGVGAHGDSAAARGAHGETTALLPAAIEDEEEGEDHANGGYGAALADARSRVRLKGSIAGMYSWCGGAAILLLTKLGGYLFDSVSTGAPFYMMAAFNAVWLFASLGIDMAREFRERR
ncbi:unnamed protein product [Parascedosporium putredinis]|uniref:MFS transporter n=1 Tax=Parascedosporium putredinis TaxID=1442378 RepID=A0A9P1GWV1_9PEZI|nr:unnamed protein product [Parascedosporium putredinis]CAI7988586.1 unnamed protein product [Parascedosporium putredinis]